MAATAAAEGSTRRRILDAALEVFLAHGVMAAPIEEVCARAPASVGSLYHHFGGKEGLAGALYLDVLESYQRAFLGALRRHADDAEGGVRGGVRNHLRWCLRDAPDRAAFLLFHGTVARGEAGEGLRELNRRFLGEVVAWWRPHVRYGVLRRLDLDLVHALWLGPAQEHSRLRLAGRSSVSLAAAERELADAAWNSLRAKGER